MGGRRLRERERAEKTIAEKTISEDSDVEILSVSVTPPAGLGKQQHPKKKRSTPPERPKRRRSERAEEEEDLGFGSENVIGAKQRCVDSQRPQRSARVEVEDHNAVCEEVIVAKPECVVDTEQAALQKTREKNEKRNEKPQRRLLDLVVHDKRGKEQPIEILSTVSLYASAVVVPVAGPLENQRGVRCKGFGPLESWCVSGYDDGVPVVWICTKFCDYICSKPAGSYRKWYTAISDKSSMCVAVFRALSKDDGGDPELSLDGLVARLSHSKKLELSQPFTREYLISMGPFISEQLTALDVEADENDQLFEGLPALVALVGSPMDDVISPFRNGKKSKQPVSLIEEESDSKRASDAHYAQLLQSRERRRKETPSKSKSYIKINEDEIAADYPLPEFYKAEEEETDEYLVMSDPDGDLENRMLHDWALYNADLRFVSLELLPMVSGAETDIEVFGSGLVTEDNFEYGMDSASAASSDDIAPQKNLLRVYLSSIKEWKIEFGAEILSISIRTDGAWYRLGNPSPRYAPWYNPVLKTARLARYIITMLKVATRVSRLSFADVTKRLAEQERDSDTYIGSNIANVQRYVVVHGQIILQQFSEFPDQSVQRSAFVAGLSNMMEERHHTKLKVSKKKRVPRGKNLNPRASLQPDTSKSKPMRATTTQLVNRIWSDYYVSYSDQGDAVQAESDYEKAQEDEDEDEDEDDDEIENLPPSVINSSRGCAARRLSQKKSCASGKSVGKDSNGHSVFNKATVRGQTLVPGEFFCYTTEDAGDAFLLVEYVYENDGRCMAHGRALVKGENTVLENAANKRELFLTENCEDVCLEDAKDKVTVELRRRPWGHSHRKANAIADEKERNRARDRGIKGLPMEYFCQALYVPEKGGFFSIPYDKLALGTGRCEGCEAREDKQLKTGFSFRDDLTSFQLDGLEYRISEFLYIEEPEIAGQSQNDIRGSRNKGLRAFTICQLVGMEPSKKDTATLTVQRFYRPEDVDLLRAYKADIHEVYYTELTFTVTPANVRGKCNVLKQQDFHVASETKEPQHLFFCSRVYDPDKETLKQLPAKFKLDNVGSPYNIPNAKKKSKMAETHKAKYSTSYDKLAMLDVFAGCGGLSEGLHQSGVASTKWAIEYDHAAAEAFKMNHPSVSVLCDNCNVILRSIMEIGGDLDDCFSTPEAAEMASRLSANQKQSLPKPGEVDFICGGPPCQGFSNMNRFKKGNWSKVQCEMILAFLSYADYFRPRYFLLENVRTFVSFNKGQTFRLTLASLLEMGYQVRFGILQAGHYGVSQSRTRAFIWAAAPGELLPEWPEPMHVFTCPALKIPVSRNSYYSAVKGTTNGAPLRFISVRDTIGDLPPVENGTEIPQTLYDKEPESWFQKKVRGHEKFLCDHICKEMNELNYIRCKRIPKRPGADWRDLPDEKVKLSTGQTVDLVPWCLPNTADRHGQWKGLFGRLDWDGNFPTSITDPNPMGKVGMCFHPEQDRMVTVRECARSQGFPDSYKFYGNIQHKHRQIGNAVPPPLANALGVKLKEAIDAQAINNSF